MRTGKARLQSTAIFSGALLNHKGEMWAWDEDAVCLSQAFPGDQQDRAQDLGIGGQSDGC